MLLKTTKQAAETLGMTHSNLRSYIMRHPELAPANSMNDRMRVWTDEEIERVREARKQRRRPMTK